MNGMYIVNLSLHDRNKANRKEEAKDGDRKEAISQLMLNVRCFFWQ
jgi:hypothetical protein